MAAEDQISDETIDSDTAVAEEEAQKLNLDVDVAAPSPCERRIAVKISRDDIDRYLDNAYGELMPTAAVPGFRTGRAPRKLVEQRFKDDVVQQVKGTLLMDSLSQVSDEQDFAAISEPDLDLEAVEMPDEGPLTFEFNIEVRPEFDMPKWKGLKLNRSVQEFSPEEIDSEVEKMLARYGQLVPHDEAASDGDYLVATIVAKADGEEVSRDEERVIRVSETLSLVDGKIEGFAKLANGKKAGDHVEASVTLTADAPNADLQGKEVALDFEILEVKKLKLPELTEDFLQEIGNFESEGDFRDAVQKNLERQLEYSQQQEARKQISDLLTEAANWELPPSLLKRQSARELERAVMELRRSGFSEAEIRARENELKQNSGTSTAASLKEHFILERIAEEEEIEAEEGDYDREVFLMSTQSGESPRRVRAQIEKRGLMDVLRNQIIERKVMEKVQAEAKFVDKPIKADKQDVEGIPFAAGGMPEAIHEITESEEATEEA